MYWSRRDTNAVRAAPAPPTASRTAAGESSASRRLSRLGRSWDRRARGWRGAGSPAPRGGKPGCGGGRGASAKPGAQLPLGASSARCLQEGAKPASAGDGQREAGRREGSGEEEGKAGGKRKSGCNFCGRLSRRSRRGKRRILSQSVRQPAGGGETGGGGGLKMATNSCGERQQPFTSRDGPCGSARP